MVWVPYHTRQGVIGGQLVIAARNSAWLVPEGYKCRRGGRVLDGVQLPERVMETKAGVELGYAT